MGTDRRQLQVVWRKSSRSADFDDASCVEVGLGADVVAIRDTKDLDGVMLLFEPDDWRSFIQRLSSSPS